MLVDPSDLYDGFRRLIENVFDFAADRSRRRFFRASASHEGEKRASEVEPGERTAQRPRKRFWRQAKI
jgi:hypothetical protein